MKHYKATTPLFITIILIMLAAITACAQPPEEEMAAARQAVEDAAADPDVRQYAPQSLEEAQQLLSEMDSAAENEEYDSARTLAEEAMSAAEQALEDAAAAKGSARDDAESAIASAVAELEEARNALEDSRDVPGIRLDFRSVERDLEDGADAVSAAEASLQDEQFAQAETTGENARSTISDVVRRISSAVQAASRK